MTADERLFFVRAMVQKRIGERADYNHFMAFNLLKRAHAAGVSIEELEGIASSLTTGKTWQDFDDAITVARAANKVDTRPTTIGEERIIVRGKLCEIKAEGDRWCVKSSRWILKRSGQWGSWANVSLEDCFESPEAAAEFARCHSVRKETSQL
jgi:hypothetical protein